MPGPIAMQGVIRHICRTEFRRLYQLLGDSELLARFLSDRDEAAFEEIVSRHGPMVRAICRRMLGSTADADDAFQATFLVFIRKARSIRRTNLLANWLCAVAYRTARQALRRRWRLGNREQNVELLPEPGRSDDPPRDWLPLFDAALQRLPSRYREAVVLCDLQGLARSEAAIKLGVNEGTLSSRLGRGRDLLRKRLVRHGFPLALGSALAPAVVPEALTASTVAAAISPTAASVSAIVLTEGVLTAMFASKLKAGLACAAIVFIGAFAGFQFSGTTTLAGGPPDKDGPAPKVAVSKPEPLAPRSPDPQPPTRLPAEFEPFQGEWIVEMAEINGAITNAGSLNVDEQWKFKSDALATGGELKEDAAEKLTLDPRAKPATIDFTLTQFMTDSSGRLSRVPYQGIYKFEADGRLIICYRSKTDDGRILRPTRFATAQNSGAILLSLRRPEPTEVTRYVPVTSYRAITERVGTNMTPPPPSGLVPQPLQPPVALVPQQTAPVEPVYTSLSGPVPGTMIPDINLLQGAWMIVVDDGKPATDKRLGIEFINDRVLAFDGTHGKFWIDESKSPKQITITIAKQPNDTTRGIYKLEGDRLTIASYNGPGKLLPTTFEPDPDAHVSVMVLERQRTPAPPPQLEPARSAPRTDTAVPSREPTRPTEREAIREVPRAPERDLLKEIDQLREQLKRLEKELKDRR
jgi:RNA polymerase sigma factor (sigma-70 family)